MNDEKGRAGMLADCSAAPGADVAFSEAHQGMQMKFKGWVQLTMVLQNPVGCDMILLTLTLEDPRLQTRRTRARFGANDATDRPNLSCSPSSYGCTTFIQPFTE